MKATSADQTPTLAQTTDGHHKTKQSDTNYHAWRIACFMWSYKESPHILAAIAGDMQPFAFLRFKSVQLFQLIAIESIVLIAITETGRLFIYM